MDREMAGDVDDRIKMTGNLNGAYSGFYHVHIKYKMRSYCLPNMTQIFRYK